MTAPRIGIIIATTRQGRFGDRPAQWIHDLAKERTDLSFEMVDLRDYPLPFFDAPMSPAYAPVDHEVSHRFVAKMEELDGFIFVVGEYNRSIPAVLKNALDHVFDAFRHKPAAYVGYGGVGGARAVEQLRMINVEQQMTPTRNAVHIAVDPYLGVLRDGKSFSDYAFLVDSAKVMLDDLAWWATTLKSGREVEALKIAAE